MIHQYYLYILTNKNNTVLYVGVTNNLERRLWEHKNASYNSFCRRYNVDKLVYLESCNSAQDAILREKQIKKWNRKKKEKLIGKNNPKWNSLNEY